MQKRLRLRNRNDFNKVYRHGKAVANHQFVLYSKFQRETPVFRMGVSVSKKVGNAVVRNRVRRVVKEIVRRLEGSVEEHYDLIFIARKPVAEMTYQEMEKSIHHLLRKAALYKRRNGSA